MRNKKFNLCTECTYCSVIHTAGFLSETHYFCRQRDDEVDTDDGCTFGQKGKPTNGVMYQTVTFEAAVNGW